MPRRKIPSGCGRAWSWRAHSGSATTTTFGTPGRATALRSAGHCSGVTRTMSEQTEETTSGRQQPTAPSEQDASEEEIAPTKEMPRPIAGGYIDRFSAKLRQALPRTRR